MPLVQASDQVKNSIRLKNVENSYRIFMPMKLKCHKHCFKGKSENWYAVTPTKFTQKGLFALTFLIINFRKLKWHQDQVHKEDKQGTMHQLPQSAGETSKTTATGLRERVKWLATNYCRREFAVCQRDTQWVVCSSEKNLLQYLYLSTCFFQCSLSALTANKTHFALDLRLFLVNLF